MAASLFCLFLEEATVPVTDTDCPLTGDTLYGLYVSWCLIHQTDPEPDPAFRAAMRQCGVDPGNSRLQMVGPAAADYILASYPTAA